MLTSCVATVPLLASLLCVVQDPPRVTRVVPDVVQAGKPSKLVVEGSVLAGATRIQLDGPPGAAARILARGKERLELEITVAEHAELGARELRVVSKSGVSNAVALYADSLPVALEAEPNDKPSAAQPLALPATVAGQLDKRADVDHYRFDAKPGQRIVFEAYAHRIGSRVDPELTVRDGRGRTIAWSDATVQGDCKLAFAPAEPGPFVLVVSDIRYRGGKGFEYRIRACARAAQRSGATGPSEVEPNDEPGEAMPVVVPATLRGRIDREDDADWYRFDVARPVTLVASVQARSIGSLVDPLLVIEDARGKRVGVDDDGGPGADSRLERAFAPGSYRLRVTNLDGSGGPEYRYVLSIGPKHAAVADYEVSLQPDRASVGRAGRAKLWCEVTRKQGFDAPVTLRLVDLPNGVTAAPVTLDTKNAWTSVFTVSAAPDAELGSWPLHVEAVAGERVRVATPEDGRAMRRAAWLTVCPASGLRISPLGPAPKQEIEQYAAERKRLEAELTRPTPKLRAELGELERSVASGSQWLTLTPKQIRSQHKAELVTLDDGSVLGKGMPPLTDTVTFVVETDLERVGAFRLDVLSDPSLPMGGPGRHGANGNFVLNRIVVTASSDRSPHDATVALARPKAGFSQTGYEVERAFDGKATTGWANNPKSGQSNWVIFEPATPIVNPGRMRFTVTLDQQFGRNHVLGRFRLSVASKRLTASATVVPPRIRHLLSRTVDPGNRDTTGLDFLMGRKDRTKEQQRELDLWFAARAPSLAKVRARIAEIDAGKGNQPRIDALERKLRADTPELRAVRAQWAEATAKKLVRWTELDFTELRSDKGVRFLREPNHVIRVRRPVADKDNYVCVSKPVPGKITGIRLEALPDRDLPAGGPGLAKSGNFVLTDISLSAWPATDTTATRPVRLASPMASFEQRGYPIAGTVDGTARTGWGVLGNIGKPTYAVWRLRTPIEHPGGTVLRFLLEHQSRNPRHQLGRFRLSVTTTPNPKLVELDLPIGVARALTTPSGRRTREQQQGIVSWFKNTAPELQPLRDQIRLLRARQGAFPPVLARGKRGLLAVEVERGELEGPIRLTLEGFSAGREKDGRPAAITRNIKVAPITLAEGQRLAVFDLAVAKKSELGTRAVVVRAEAGHGASKVVEYSAAIPLTVVE